MPKQVLVRGNPEQKLSMLVEDFSGGMDIKSSDDLMDQNTQRFLMNYDVDQQGALTPRKGWGKHRALTALLSPSADSNHIKVPSVITEGQDITSYIESYEKSKYVFTNVNELRKGSRVMVMGKTIQANKSFTATLGKMRICTNNEEIKPVFTAISAAEKVTTPVLGKRGYAIPTLTENFIRETTVDEDGNTFNDYLTILVNGYESDVLSDIKASIVDGPSSTLGAIGDILYMSPVVNEGNLFERFAALGPDEDPAIVYERLGLTVQKIVLLVIYTLQGSVLDNTLGNEKIAVHTISLNVSRSGIKVSAPDTKVSVITAEFLPYKVPKTGTSYNINNVNSVVFNDAVYLISNDKAIIRYDIKTGNVTAVGGTFTMKTYSPNFPTGQDKTVPNEVYAPNPLEIRHVGFNVLADKPLGHISESPSTVYSVQGIYLTFTNDKNQEVPLANIPMGSKFFLHVIYTGKIDKFFKLEFKQGGGENAKEVKATVDNWKKLTDKGSNGGVARCEVTFTSGVVGEVEMKLTKVDGEASDPVHYEYFQVYTPPADTRPIKTLDVGKHSIRQVYDRMVLFSDDTLWYTDIGRYDYIPNLNYITLPIAPTDYIVDIVFFRSSYIIFTKERIYKLTGYLGATDSSITIVSDTLGCIAPHSIQMVNNKLYFLSAAGLARLKTEVFRENLENIDLVDDKISKLIPKKDTVYSESIDGSYYLYTNIRDRDFTNAVLDKANRVNVGGTVYPIPDVIKFDVETNAYTLEYYAPYNAPMHIMNVSGSLYSYRGNSLHDKEYALTDFGFNYKLLAETPGYNFNYPSNEKKFKQLIVKLGKEAYQQDVKLTVLVDGDIKHTQTLYPESVISEVDMDASRFHIRKVRLPSLKGKNIALRIETDTSVDTTIIAVSYIYKLGKMRERRPY